MAEEITFYDSLEELTSGENIDDENRAFSVSCFGKEKFAVGKTASKVAKAACDVNPIPNEEFLKAKIKALESKMDE